MARSLFVGSMREAQFTFALDDTHANFKGRVVRLATRNLKCSGGSQPLFVPEERKHRNGHDVGILGF